MRVDNYVYTGCLLTKLHTLPFQIKYETGLCLPCGSWSSAAHPRLSSLKSWNQKNARYRVWRDCAGTDH